MRAGAKRSFRRSLIYVWVLSLLLMSFVPFLGIKTKAAEPTGYVHAVTITFGSFNFYYDYGVWNVNEFDYVASADSTYPANGTTTGQPGWYGFDGHSNLITVEYKCDGAANSYIDVTLSFTHLPDYSGVTMELYEKNGEVDDANKICQYGEKLAGTTFTVQQGVGNASAHYISFSGVPQKSGNDLISGETQPFGQIKITIGKPKT